MYAIIVIAINAIIVIDLSNNITESFFLNLHFRKSATTIVNLQLTDIFCACLHFEYLFYSIFVFYICFIFPISGSV